MSQCNSLSRICIRTPRLSNTHPRPATLTQRRHESTTRRHKKLLHVAEAPSYTASGPTPTLIYNPPSSAPSVYHTPAKFLPKDDKRTALYRQALALSTPTTRPGTPLYTTNLTSHSPHSSTQTRTTTSLPPPVRPPYAKTYNVTPAAMAEIQRLRAEDPEKWTRVKLAERFGCSQFFVGIVAKNAGKAERVRAEHDKVRERWGKVRRAAREDRGRRREAWGRDA